MSRWSVLLAVVGLLGATVILSVGLRSGAGAQDRTEERLADLETRVAVLETARAGGDGGSATAASASTHMLTGTFRLVSRYLEWDAGHCNALSSSVTEIPESIRVGATVEVKDETNQIVAIGAIESSDREIDSSGRQHYSGTCDLAFRVEDVPVASFYKIAVGGLEMPAASYEELEALDWDITFTITGA